MATVSLSPILNAYQSFLTTGLPNNGGFIYTYQAGTSTPQATYTTNSGGTPNANPIPLSADGRPPQEIWLTDGVAYKFVVTDANSAPIAGASFDNISGAISLASTVGRLLNVQKFTASGTYTPTAGTTSILVRVQGGGASGGGCAATGGAQVSAGAGGSAGAYAESYITTGFSGAAVTIGAGGVGVSGQASNNGVASSFGALVTAPGGLGGSSGGPTTAPYLTGGAPSAVATGGSLINATGAPGEAGIALSTTVGFGGKGGSAAFGGGGAAAAIGVNGATAGTFGAGGGGTMQGASAAALTGGAGMAGVVLVYEFGAK